MFMTDIVDSELVALSLLRPTMVTVSWMDDVESRRK